MNRLAYKQSAFTLIEVLITLTIVSLLTAIALPQYNEYKKQAFDVRALSDLRSAAIAQEAYFMQTENYLSCQQSNCTQLPGLSRLSKGVLLEVLATDRGFVATASHPMGSGKFFTWDSQNGGLQE